MPESVEEIRVRARSWLPKHMPSMDSAPPLLRDSEESWAILDGRLPPAAGSIIRSFMASSHTIETDTAIAITGPAAVVGDDESLLSIGQRYLGRQIANIGGGTTEMASNIIAESVLTFRREYAADRGVPFRQVRRGTSVPIKERSE